MANLPSLQSQQSSQGTPGSTATLSPSILSKTITAKLIADGTWPEILDVFSALKHYTASFMSEDTCSHLINMYILPFPVVRNIQSPSTIRVLMAPLFQKCTSDLSTIQSVIEQCLRLLHAYPQIPVAFT